MHQTLFGGKHIVSSMLKAMQRGVAARIDTGPNLTWTQPWFENKVILASNKKGSVPHNIQCRQPKLPDVKISGNTFTFKC